MTATSSRVHMAQGQGDYSFNFHPELVEELREHNHLIIYEMGREIDLGEIVGKPQVRRDGIVVMTRGLEHHLGGENVGVLIEEAEFVSGNEKLSNPDFSRDENEWVLPEGTLWSIQGGRAIALAPPPPDPFAPVDLEEEEKSDILASDESFTVKAGQQYAFSMTAYRSPSSTGVGRLRLRVVHEGKFNHIQRALPYTEWDLRTFGLKTALSSGFVADVKGHGRDQTPVIQWADNGGYNQTWRVEDASATTAYIIATESRLALDVFAGGTADGTAVIVEPFHGGLSQQWTFEEDPTNPDTYRIRSAHSGKYLTVPSDSLTQGDPLQIFSASGATGQRWIRTARGGMARFSGGDPLNAFGESIRIQSERPNLIRNPSFDAGLNDWVQMSGVWGTEAGPDGTVVYVDGDATVDKQLWADADPSAAGAAHLPVSDGEEYQIEGWTHPVPGVGTDGEAVVTIWVGSTPAPGPLVPAPPTGYYIEPLRSRAFDDNWRWRQERFTVDPTHTMAMPRIQAVGHTTGRWQFDNIRLFRTQGNIDTAYHPGFAVVPERSYNVRVRYYSEAPVEEGLVQLRAVIAGAGRPTQTLYGPPLSLTQGNLAVQEWDLSTPSGYDWCIPYLWSSDVFGGAVWVGPWSIRDADDSTAVGEWATSALAAPLATTTAGGTLTSPAGSDSFHVEVVKETDGVGWEVTEVSVKRTGVPTSTGEQLVTYALQNHVTGNRLLPWGNIGPAGIIGWDYEVKDQTNRQLLAAVSRTGLVLPVREWRFNFDGSMDWDIAENLCTDWSPDSDTPVLLEENGFTVVKPLDIEYDSEEVAEAVKVVGNLRTGKKTPIVGRASTVYPDARGWFGEPLNRTLLVTESSLDHPSFATAYAMYRLNLQKPRLTVKIELQGARLFPLLREGDWVYVYNPQAGLEDRSVFAVTPQGRHIHPMRLRITTITRHLSEAQHEIRVRRPDGSLYQIPNDWVRWESPDTIELDLGDRPPEFASDPQGGAGGKQLLRWLASSPH